MNEKDNYFVIFPAGELPRVDVPVGDVNEDAFLEYPIDNIPGVDVELGDAELTGVDVRTHMSGHRF